MKIVELNENKPKKLRHFKRGECFTLGTVRMVINPKLATSIVKIVDLSNGMISERDEEFYHQALSIEEIHLKPI